MDFPFTIMDVASLLRLNIRRRGPGQVYADCPICGDRRGKMNLNLTKNVWRCNYCGEGGGMLALYARVRGIGSSDAYREICDALQTGQCVPAVAPPQYKAVPRDEVPQSPRASERDIHRTLTALLSLLTLTPAHQEHLRTKRGLTDGQIGQYGFKSTPPPYLCRTITDKLMASGFMVQGVPGFYQDSGGKWTVKFHQRTSGIIIPIQGVSGLLHGLQIRLDRPIKNEGDPPEKQGTKYLPLSSVGKPMGVTSGSPVHFVGNPGARVVYVTEGALKADIAHALTGRAFAATAGANNTSGLDSLFAFLRRNGTEEIIEAEDMDKYCNQMVNTGSLKIHQLAAKHGLMCRRLVWNPNHKGIDDWLLALKRKNETYEEAQEMSAEQQVTQRFRVYQLDVGGIETYPFAFRSLERMHKAGYQQPPAESYRLVYDGELLHPEGEQDSTVLERIFFRCNDSLPAGYQGHSLSMSDVVELYDEDSHRFFYCDTVGFALVQFDTTQIKAMAGVSTDG